MAMGLILSLLIIAFGAIFQLDLFLHNSFGVVFFVLFLFQLAMASFAFLCSIPIRKVCCTLLSLHCLMPHHAAWQAPCRVYMLNHLSQESACIVLTASCLIVSVMAGCTQSSLSNMHLEDDLRPS